MAEYEALTNCERNPRWVQDNSRRIRMHLIPFFGEMALSTINGGTVQDYRISSINVAEDRKPPSRSTLHHETVTLRQVLKTAVRQGWITRVPDVSAPYKGSGKIVHLFGSRPTNTKSIYDATRAKIKQAKGERNKYLAEQLHDTILLMANSDIRPDEANWLEYRDVEVVEDEATGEAILEIAVRGKRGVGCCKSTTGAVRPFQRMLERNDPDPMDRLFAYDHKKQFNRILEDQGLKFGRQGNRRTLCSLRHHAKQMWGVCATLYS